MKEDHIRNDLRLSRLSRPSSNTIQDASTHEAVVGIGFCSPDTATKANQGRNDEDWSSPKASLNWHPDEVTESKDENSNSGELYNIGEAVMKLLDIITEHGCQSEWAESLGEGD